MAKKTFTRAVGSIVSKTAAIEQRQGLRLSDVIQESIQKLRSNPLNAELFDYEESVQLERLKKDIEERGILVPLIAKTDGTLLAGHNRLAIAQELGLHIVPVQYVEDMLSSEAERKFVIGDNLLRRQLTNEQRMNLYRILYPNFEERIRSNAGRPQKNSGQKNMDTVHISQKSNSLQNFSPLTAADIARDTGQSVSAVQKQFQRQRKEKSIEKNSPIAKRPHTSTTSDDKQAIDKNILKKIEKDLSLVLDTNEATQKEVLKTLKMFIKKNAV